MAARLFDPAGSVALMVGARLLNLAVGLVGLPVLIRYLGGEAFAAWALLLALAGGFSLLELGMTLAVVRFLAVPAQQGRWTQARELLGRAWLVLAGSFGLGALAVLALARPLADWLGLPAAGGVPAHQAILGVFAAVALRAFLQSGTWTLIAARRFGAVSAVSVLQPLAANIAAMLAAWCWGRLDAALLAFWGAQLAVVGAVFLLQRRRCAPRFGAATWNRQALGELLHYGLANQAEGWAQFVNFQFDKFLIAAWVGLWGVAPYEVANRAVAALRSIPASGADTFLPNAMVRADGARAAWDWYLASTRLAAYGVVVFLLAPLAVAPVFLYAWTGEMGHLGSDVFVALCIGTVASVLALPAATLAQAQGRPALQARAAGLAVALNLPLSLLLVLRFGALGAAIGSACAMALSAALLVWTVHRHFGQPLAPTLAVLARFWPVVLVCALWGVAGAWIFDAWFETLPPQAPYARALRVAPGLCAVGAYVLCIACVAAVELARGAFTAGELAWLRACFTRRR
ncbi:MAG: polysaccharide biosynthesis C-terminal domain-containing protein [Pseudomonadota bacterium]